jgi:hypothetical protein
MNQEQAAKIGAKWWTDQLAKKSEQNTGYALLSMATSWAENKVREANPLTAEKLAVFQSHLEASLLASIQETEWLEENPDWGSASRIVGVDYHPGRTLREAAIKAGINELHFPVKTVMWLDPDNVKVSLGYQGEIEEIE